VERPVAAVAQFAANILGQKAAADVWKRGNGDDFADLIALNVGRGSTTPVRAAPSANLANTSGDRLTQREHMVLQHLIDGRTDREIAARLFISRRTVSKHLEAIFTKLCVHSRGAAVAEAQRLGLSTTPLLDDTDSAITAD
jgi:DNA-binding NarL/FixJ family response regulator